MKHTQDHFSAIAPQYALGRIAYPEDLYRFLVAQCHGQDLAWDCAAGSGQATSARFAETDAYPERPPWRPVTASTTSSADTVTTSIQQYLAAQANRQMGVPDDVIAGTRARYIEAFECLTGQRFAWK